jgi:uncharacterized protein YecE (DUF72 family)
MEAQSVNIGTVDLPDRRDRDSYFRELSYLELSILYAGPVRPSILAKWKAAIPSGKSVGLVAPWVLTDRKPPKAPQIWNHDATVAEFRDSAPAREALDKFREALTTLGASYAVFRSPSLFAPSAANRESMTRFFAEVAPLETMGAPVVWIPDGLWEPRTAITFANELGIVCAFDPIVREPGQPPEIYYDLDVEALYLRISGLGRAGSMRAERHEDLAMLIESYGSLPVTVAFDSPQRWQDARNFKKLLTATSEDD